MQPENRHERFISYTELLRERFESGVLAELQPHPQWVVWRAEIEGEKQNKVPYTPHSHLARASVKIPTSWRTLAEALISLESGNYSGLGFMLTLPLVKERSITPKLPYKYSYKILSDGDNKSRKLMIEDWELGAL